MDSIASNSLTNIENLVTSTFANALNNGDIIFQGYKVVEELIDGCSYQIRHVATLQNKPEKDQTGKTDKDPLAPPYEKSLHVCDLTNYGLNTTDYAVVLNKFPAIKNHFLLIPQEFAKQSDPLTEDDLSLTYQIIRNFRTKLIAFSNCGEESGASQKHKHVQFFPLSENEPPIDVYLKGQNIYEQASQLIQVPWAHFIISIHPPEQSEQLGNYLMQKFIQLLDEMFSFKEGKEFDGAKASYNVLITKNYMHLIPRSREDVQLPNGSTKSTGGLNYAGIIDVKQEEDMNELIKVGITNVLLSTGRKKDQHNEE